MYQLLNPVSILISNTPVVLAHVHTLSFANECVSCSVWYTVIGAMSVIGRATILSELSYSNFAKQRAHSEVASKQL